MPYCVDEFELNPSRHRIVSGPWPDHCRDCGSGSSSSSKETPTPPSPPSPPSIPIGFGQYVCALRKESNRIFCLEYSSFLGSEYDILLGPFSGSGSDGNTCADCASLGSSSSSWFEPESYSSSSSTTMPEFAPGATGFGDVHMGWPSGSPKSALVYWDDNKCLKAPIDPKVAMEMLDHYAVEWIERKKDGTVHAILSERWQICMWPGNTIAKSIVTIGNPTATALLDCSELICPTCGDCSLATTWCSVTVNWDPSNYKELESYGGMHIDNMMYISGFSDVSQGVNGPLGGGVGPSGFRIVSESPPSEETVAALFTGGVQGSPAGFYNKVASLANTTPQISDSIIEQRLNAAPRAPGLISGDDPCCRVSDLDYPPYSDLCDPKNFGKKCLYFCDGISWFLVAKGNCVLCEEPADTCMSGGYGYGYGTCKQNQTSSTSCGMSTAACITSPYCPGFGWTLKENPDGPSVCVCERPACDCTPFECDKVCTQDPDCIAQYDCAAGGSFPTLQECTANCVDCTPVYEFCCAGQCQSPPCA